MASTVNPNTIVCLTAPDSVGAEAYRTLRTNITMRGLGKPVQLINIISANAQEAKTTTAVNLAIVYAQLGKKVLLIDLDLRLASIHKKLGIKNISGITDVVTNNRKFEDVVIHHMDNLDVLLSGVKIDFTSELVQSAALRDFLESMKNIYDVIIVDCPPVNLVTDGLIASTYCDGTLMCIASGYDEKRELEKAKEALENVGANVLGVVMTRMPEGKKYYSYKYKYGYGYHSSSSKSKKKNTFFGGKRIL